MNLRKWRKFLKKKKREGAVIRNNKDYYFRSFTIRERQYYVQNGSKFSVKKCL